MLSSPRLDGQWGRLREAIGGSEHPAFLSCIPTDGRAYVDPLASPHGLPTAPPPWPILSH
jgi:hypothetical protein